MKKIKLLGKRLLVRRFKDDGVTDGGIVLPDRRRPKDHTFGVVEVVGCDCDDQIKVGDTILTKESTGSWIKTDSGDRLLMYSADVLAVVEDYNQL